MQMVAITPVLDEGLYIGTKKSGSSVVLAPQSLVTTFPLDTSVWQQNGSGWVVSGDKVTIDNTDNGDKFLNLIYNINQSVIKDVTFRLIVEGEGIDTFTGDNFSIQLKLTDAGGLGGTILANQLVAFPSGTWPEREISITLTPTAPAIWLYAYIFTRNSKGKVTFRNAEVFQVGDTDRTFGQWTSKVFDLAKLASQSIVGGDLSLTNVGFYYSNIANVDDMDSVDHSIEALSKYDVLVINEPNLNTSSREQYVQNALVSKVQVYGYAQIGPQVGEVLADLVTAAKAIMDRCAAAGYAGVFFDMFGYDWGVDRASQNDVVSYAHSKGLKCMPNAWMPEDCLDSKVDATYNPNGDAPVLGPGDWYVFESFYSQNSGYTGSSTSFLSVFQKYSDGVALAKLLGVKTLGLTYSLTTVPKGDYTEWTKAYLLALGLGMDGLCYTTDLQYLDWDPSLFTSPTIGSRLVQSYETTDIDTYEAMTDLGVVQFIAHDDPDTRLTDRFKILGPTHVTLTSPPATATQVETQYYSSSDAETWKEIHNTTVSDRFFRMQLTLRS